MMLRFWIGETVRVSCQFNDDAGNPVAVVGVSIRAKAPDGSAVVGTPIARQTTGAFYADFPLTQAGIWNLRATCTGPTPAAIEDRVEARPSNVI